MRKHDRGNSPSVDAVIQLVHRIHLAIQETRHPKAEQLLKYNLLKLSKLKKWMSFNA